MPSEIKLLQDFASYCAQRNKIISQNIANIGTENYHSQDVVFKNVLNDNMNSYLKIADGLQPAEPDNNSTPPYQIITDNSKDNVSEVNNVDIDKQMANLAQNQLNFSFAANKIGDYFKDIDSVIKGTPA